MSEPTITDEQARTILHDAARRRELAGVGIDIASFLVLSTEATNPQRAALLMLTQRYGRTVESVQAFAHAFDLPAEWISVQLLDNEGRTIITGGISPDGQVST